MKTLNVVVLTLTTLLMGVAFAGEVKLPQQVETYSIIGSHTSKDATLGTQFRYKSPEKHYPIDVYVYPVLAEQRNQSKSILDAEVADFVSALQGAVDYGIYESAQVVSINNFTVSNSERVWRGRRIELALRHQGRDLIGFSYIFRMRDEFVKVRMSTIKSYSNPQALQAFIESMLKNAELTSDADT